MQRRTVRTALAVAAVATGLVTSTPAAAAGTVAGTGVVHTGGTPLTMREAPASSAEKAGAVAHGGKLWIMCQVAGQQVTGSVRTTRAWLRLANGRYVSDAYVVRTGVVVPVCAGGAAPARPALGSWTSPLAAPLVSGFRTQTRPGHDGVDLSAARFTPIRAAAAGRVTRVVCNVSAGSCDTDGRPSLRGCGWYAEIRHPGDVVTRYCHMVRRPPVTVGQTVAKGQTIGHVGTSGSSSGPHLHFEVHTGSPATRANAVNPVFFMRARGILL